MNKFSLEAKVGIFFIACAVIFAYVWFKVLDFNIKEGFQLKARFKSAEGLVKDSQVQIAGIKVGTVKDIAFDPETGKAMVLMDIKDTYRNAIPEDSRVSVKTKGLLGDKFIVIEPGRPNARKLKPGEEFSLVFEPTDTEKVFESMGVVTQDLQALTREARKQIIDEKGSQKMDNIITNTDSVMKIMNELLTKNQEKLDRSIANIDVASGDLSEITSRNKEKIHGTIDQFERFSKSMDKSSDKFARAANEVEALTRDIRTGKGTLGKLATDESLFRDTQALVRDFRGVAGSIQRGQGTVGRLINDPDMYFEARRAIRNMNKSAEDISDATPISTLATILGAVLK